jgi:hypothetical protein
MFRHAKKYFRLKKNILQSGKNVVVLQVISITDFLRFLNIFFEQIYEMHRH